MPFEGKLQIDEHPIAVGESFDRVNASFIHLYRQHQTRARGNAVDPNGARATHAVFTTDVGSGRAQFVAQEIAEKGAWFGVSASLAAVQAQGD